MTRRTDIMEIIEYDGTQEEEEEEEEQPPPPPRPLECPTIVLAKLRRTLASYEKAVERAVKRGKFISQELYEERKANLLSVIVELSRTLARKKKHDKELRLFLQSCFRDEDVGYKILDFYCSDVTFYYIHRSWSSNMVDSSSQTKYIFSERRDGAMTDTYYDGNENHEYDTSLKISVAHPLLLVCKTFYNFFKGDMQHPMTEVFKGNIYLKSRFYTSYRSGEEKVQFHKNCKIFGIVYEHTKKGEDSDWCTSG
jgi:hypothetical protein